MTKKDRIAIAVSVIYFIFAFTMAAADSNIFRGLFFGLVPLSLYWGYRFIKDDISFMQQENNSK